ncbi:peptide ABC transporter substrate-binding protein [Bordetella genomosp. 9]|uniref:Peptide ABC transporter substrate-binding protein n=1 Tax=Bordetella genomosp. 9 TaxID=1416803 RepID=A0A261R5F4_9BORD|nr:ABC transporter substrate-binding protein [Bordetella genomosp. 9]OZI20275.1 peptide ABC transporter substrate-binding protein [Bordetella genomosp. 9]
MDRRTFLITTSASAASLALPGYLRAAPRVEFRWVPQTDLTLLDPTFTTATITQNHAQMVFDTLYGMDNDYQPHPQMAAGHEMDADQLRWVITLRDQLVFHDGSPVRAQDAVASLRRWAQRDLMGKSLMAATAELTALNDKQFQFKLKQPFPLLLHALGRQTGSMAAIMPERLAKGPEDKPVTEMIGSGPFRFMRDQWVSGSRVVYEKFAGYVPRKDSFPPQFSAGPKVAYMDEVRWNVVPDRATAIAALQAHEVDGVEAVDKDFIGALKADPSITLLKRSLPTVAILRFNHLQPPFNNVLMRRAVLASINQTDYMTAINGSDFKEYWTDRMGVFVPGTPMATEAGMDKLTGKRNLDKVRADIKAAGYKGEPIVLIDPADFPDYHAAALVTADLFKRIGLNVDVQTMDWGTAVQRRNNQDAPGKGGWNIAFTGLTGPNNLDPAGHLALRGNGKAAWWGWPDSPKLEQLRQDWFNAPDLATQKKICEQIQLQVIEDVPYVPLGASYQVSAYGAEWKDFQPQLPLFYTARKA